MTLSKIREAVLSERILWIENMISGIEDLPLKSFEIFSVDKKNTAAAESFLRRAIEALMDLGRHIIAKGFAADVPDYKSISGRLSEFNIIGNAAAGKMKLLAGYRNRMVHFYNEISDKELYDICTGDYKDIIIILNEIRAWINSHPESIDKTI